MRSNNTRDPLEVDVAFKTNNYFEDNFRADQSDDDGLPNQSKFSRKAKYK